ncbi:Nucleotide-binding universal stress protein, UspA family [Saccharicrinis carchari]|uniref:Nucleotide-binding universal stress protein, UspA family n=1 Tax=Saccharicrinis carchari TaxID=1168039 RepID=A0A521AUF8_SACCC|nr:universal stress protein [Saccharicrinis carchari]SMO38488.1 Nucleotide-binding universal stress protein, UspA family [Saccharicrinis carchari]
MKDNIITLATLTYGKAQVVKSMLANEGVECFLEHVNLIQGAVSAGVKVNIKESDFKKAQMVFDSIRESDYEKPHSAEKISNDIKVLVPVDFSEYSQKAVDMAFDWVAQNTGELTLFNAFYSPLSSGLPFGESFVYDINSDQISFELKEESEKKIEELKKGLEKRIKDEKIENVRIYTELRRGIAEHEILEFSETYNPSLIVMGTRGSDKKAVDLIGSVTTEIIDGAKVPVLAVPESFDYKGLDKLKTVGYLSVFGPSDFVAIEKLSSILGAFDVNVKCAHITSGKNMQTDKVKMDGLIEHFNKNKIATSLDFKLIENEDFWVGVESFVQSENIEILSFTTFKRNLLSRLLNPSIAKKMLFHSTTPLLVFHA